MGAIARAVQGFICAPEHVFVSECVQQLVVAGAGFVSPGQNCIHNAQLRVWAEAKSRHPGSRRDGAVSGCAVFQCPHDGRADRHDASAFAHRGGDRFLGADRDAIRLVQRQPAIQLGIAGRRNSRGMRQRRELDAALFECGKHLPVEHESR